ncbi:hypothetical protein C6500_16405 [Candidatus Poribacteria bacterium]|nr:MAG: hypothetical protein C6500_16405 [Candidatus Poribacteria bacterium]
MNQPLYQSIVDDLLENILNIEQKQEIRNTPKAFIPVKYKGLAESIRHRYKLRYNDPVVNSTGHTKAKNACLYILIRLHEHLQKNDDFITGNLEPPPDPKREAAIRSAEKYKRIIKNLMIMTNKGETL